MKLIIPFLLFLVQLNQNINGQIRPNFPVQGFYDQPIFNVVNPGQFGFFSDQPAQSRSLPRFRHSPTKDSQSRHWGWHHPHWHPHWDQCPFENEANMKYKPCPGYWRQNWYWNSNHGHQHHKLWCHRMGNGLYHHNIVCRTEYRWRRIHRDGVTFKRAF